MIDITTIQKVYISGIGGIGVSGLAQILHAQNIEVSGSDIEKSHVTELLESKGVKINYEQIDSNINADVSVHIYSPAVPITNPERQAVEQLDIQSYSYPEFLGLLSENFDTLAISGTNGKTTTTALVGHIFEENGKDPQVLVGSLVPKWGSNIKLGKSNYFIIESCEHQAHMTLMSAQNAIITNIEADHLDFYSGIDEIRYAFSKFVYTTKDSIIMNADDAQSQLLIDSLPETVQRRIITFGIAESADFNAQEITIKDGMQHFKIYHNNTYVTDASISLPGNYSISNALAAIALCHKYGISIKDSARAVATFKSTWRRFERLGTYKNASIISDYAHHPSAVNATISATKELFPDKKLIVVFQPHQHNRTKNLFNEFVQSFNDADSVILADIFDVAGREEHKDQNVSSQDLVEEISKKHDHCWYAKDFDQVETLIDQEISENSIVMIMGAGDIYKIAENLVKK